MSSAPEYPEPRPELLAGTVDLHIHSAPDIFPRLVTAISAAEEAKRYGMAGIVVKSHSTDTAARAETARDATDFPVLGGVVLNYPVGGLNEYAVLETARQGGRIVWMPTINARHFINNSAGGGMLAEAIPPGVSGLTAVDDGEVNAAALRVLDMVAQHDLTLATGHLHPDESLVLVPEAFRRGVKRVIVTHPHLPFVGMPPDTAKKLGEAGAYIEVTEHESIEERVKMIRTVGADRCFLSTDGGTVSAPAPVVRLSASIAALLDQGFSEEEVRHMSATIPSYLVGL